MMENVTYIDAVIEELQEHLATLHKLVQKRVLPNSRYPLIRKLDAINTLCQQLQELLQRSGMDRRLGFLREGKSVQPVMLQPAEKPDVPLDSDLALARSADLMLHAHGISGRVNDPDATEQEGSGL